MSHISIKLIVFLLIYAFVCLYMYMYMCVFEREYMYHHCLTARRKLNGTLEIVDEHHKTIPSTWIFFSWKEQKYISWRWLKVILSEFWIIHRPLKIISFSVLDLRSNRRFLEVYSFLYYHSHILFLSLGRVLIIQLFLFFFSQGLH